MRLMCPVYAIGSKAQLVLLYFPSFIGTQRVKLDPSTWNCTRLWRPIIVFYPITHGVLSMSGVLPAFQGLRGTSNGRIASSIPGGPAMIGSGVGLPESKSA
jgi:hypothetical protein